MSQVKILMAACVIIAAGSLCPAAEQSPTPQLQPPSYKPPVLDPNFVAPKISQEYAQKLTELPDWTGSWFITGGYLFDPANAWMPINNDEAFDTGPLEGSIVRNIPYKPEYQKQYEKTVADAVQGIITDPVGACQQPHGMPRELGGVPGGPEIIILPNQVRMTYYWFNATRRIYTDGRPHPTGVDLVPTYMGHAIGKWEGDTLVVDTVGMNPGIYDRTGAPHSGEVHVMERMRLVGPDLLEDQIVIEDPVMLTQPWKVTRYMRRMSRMPQSEGAYCEGGRIDMSSGTQRIVLPDEQQLAEPEKKGFWRRLFGGDQK
jgi:hypothetical protein